MKRDPLFIIIDLFCGAGGVSTGFIKAMYNDSSICKVIGCINHDHKAILSHWANYPEVKHFEEDIRNLNLDELLKLVQYYRKKYPNAKLILWASLECTNFSKAKGGLARDADSRTLAYSLNMKWNEKKKDYTKGKSYMQLLDPDYLLIENVVEFKDWAISIPKFKNGKPVMIKNKHGEMVQGYMDDPKTKGQMFNAWCESICKLGYKQEWKQMNSADYGAYTSRNRLFGMFAKPDCDMIWPEPTHHKKGKGGLQKWNAVKHKLDFSDEGYSIFYRGSNPNIPKRQRKDLVNNTMERIYAGCIKHIAGGKLAFMARYNGTFKGAEPRTYDLENPLTTIDTGNRHSLIQPQFAFIDQANSGDPGSKIVDINGPARTLTAKGGNQRLVQANFISKYYSGKPEGKNISTDGPAGAVTTVGNQALVQAEFLMHYYSGGGGDSSVNDPHPVVTTRDGDALVKADFISKKYSGPENTSSTDEPVGALLKDAHALVQTSFLDRQFTGGGQNSSVEQPAGSIPTVPKLNLVNATMIDNTNYDNVPSSTEDPLNVITANRKYPYLLTLQYKTGQMRSVDKPSNVILASSHKTPTYLFITETGDAVIEVYETDSPIIVKLKEFMALYGIVDIKMRMLRVDELLKIQGFPDEYKLHGSQEDQKKFIGNSVVPDVVKAWAEALAMPLIEEQRKRA